MTGVPLANDQFGKGHRTQALVRVASVGIVLILTLSSLALMLPSVCSDPDDIDNPDNTRSLIWEFEEPADYVLSDAQVADGLGSLLLHDESAEEDTKEAFDQGVRKDNISTEALPDSIVLDVSNIEVHSLNIQPGAEGIDSYISEATTSSNFGADISLRANSEDGDRMNIVMWFDISALPSDVVIHDATLWLYLTGGRTQELVLKAYPLTRDFDEMEVTWMKNISSSTWSAPGGDYDDPMFSRITVRNILGWYKIDLSRMVELWAKGTIANKGLILVPAVTTGDTLKEFRSSDDGSVPSERPLLSINYSQPGVLGTYESRALGPGVNTTFTTVNWSCTTVSFASDEFSGAALSPKWSWLNDPFADDGAYDVGENRSGWIHVEGSPKTDLTNNRIDANFLNQNITGNFASETRVETFFAASTMGAGLLVANDMLSWAAIYVINITDTIYVFVKVGEGGEATMVSQTLWGNTSAYLRIERTGSMIALEYGSDGESWIPAYTYTPPVPFSSRLKVGMCVLSGTANIGAVAEFDYCRIDPLDALDTAVLRARTGNSSLLTDPSWTSWSEELEPEVVLQRIAQYMQYSVVMECPYDWCSPAFSAFTCCYEHFSSEGTIETIEYTVMDFSRWYTIAMEDDASVGSILYSWSSDNGMTWSTYVEGGSYSIYAAEPSIRIRIHLTTDNTAYTPTVDRVEVLYVTALMSFYVIAPSQVVAGDAFSVTLYARDESNATMTAWRGTVNLNATDSEGLEDATEELLVTEAYISSLGYVTVLDERYNCAETIRIRASAGDVFGLSGPITVLPGPAQGVSISPVVDALIEFRDYEFVATGYDEFANPIHGLEFTWYADAALGSLTVDGGTAILHTGASGGEGVLRVTCQEWTASLEIRLIRESTPPEFVSEIPVQHVVEDSEEWTLDLTPYVFDAEDGADGLRWYITNETLVIIGQGENVTGDMNLTFGTVPDAFGTNELDLFIVDSVGMSNSTRMIVEVEPVNDRPTIDHIPPLVVTFDQGYIYDFSNYVHDVDDPKEMLRLDVDEASKPYATPNLLQITFDYPESLNGTTLYVIVTVSDEAELSSYTVVQVTVSDDRVPVPEKALPDVTVDQGDTARWCFDLDEYFTDPDGDVLFFSWSCDHVEVVINANHTVDFLAPIDWHGEDQVVFRASDPAGARAEQWMKVTVLHINQPPFIQPVPDLGVRYDQRYEFDLKPYLSDPDGAVDSLVISTNDSHIAVLGTVLSMLYPQSMNGLEVPVLLTASDESLHAYRSINITVSDNSPPVAGELPDHEFMEDGPPLAYPTDGWLGDFFTDLEDPDELTFYAFTSPNHVGANVSRGRVLFTPTPDYYGTSWLTLRAADTDGGIAERSVVLTVIPTPDAPVLWLPNSLLIEFGKQVAYDLSLNVTDPDPEDEDFTFQVSSNVDGLGFAVLGSVLVLDFPEWFMDGYETSRTIEMAVTVTDPSELSDTQVVSVTVYRSVESGRDNVWLWATIFVLGGTALGSALVAARTRKRPFVIRDMMLIHNDGFLMARHAAVHKGEVDEQILSGMLTAVLNFVEDSMDTTHDQLKTFGFRDMKVIVKRGHNVYAAIVYEGDIPDDIEDDVASFLGKVERVYKKTIADWTGDLETDYAGMGMLIRNFVSEHSRKSNGEGGAFLKSGGLNGKQTGPTVK